MALNIFVTTSNNRKPTFIIAEIGQNHQGDINIAKKLILAAKQSGADCVKFQKTSLPHKFNKAALENPYSSKNSWGVTYGEHKKHLEFCEDDFRTLQSFSKENEILFTASPMDIYSLQFLISLKVPFIKIGSGDCNNFPLIEEAAKSEIPLIISTGMQSLETVKTVYNLVSKYHKNFCLLHCISSYPTPIESINLHILSLFQDEFNDIPIGYSGHELGFFITVSSVALGAKVIERHLTLDKTQKGSDHICSLDPQEFTTMVTQIKQIETALGSRLKTIQECERACYEKLGKTLVVNKNLTNGHLLLPEDLDIKVALPKGIDGTNLHKVIGKRLLKDMLEDESLLLENVGFN